MQVFLPATAPGPSSAPVVPVLQDSGIIVLLRQSINQSAIKSHHNRCHHHHQSIKIQDSFITTADLTGDVDAEECTAKQANSSNRNHKNKNSNTTRALRARLPEKRIPVIPSHAVLPPIPGIAAITVYIYVWHQRQPCSCAS